MTGSGWLKCKQLFIGRFPTFDRLILSKMSIAAHDYDFPLFINKKFIEWQNPSRQ